MSRAARIAVLLGLAGLGLSCHNKAKQDLADFNQAKASFEKAKALLAEGKPTPAHDAWQECRDKLLEIRRRAGRGGMDEYELPDGPEVAGRTAKAWQDWWWEDFHDQMGKEFDSLRARAAAGEVDWGEARAFFNTFDNKLADRWTETAETVARATNAREGEVYHVECDFADEAWCDTLRAAIAKKLARPMVTERFLTSEARASAFGLVEVHSSALNYQGYEVASGNAAPTHEEVLSLPTRLGVSIKVSTRRGSSSWDGERRLAVGAEAPVAVSDSERTAAMNRQFALLEEKMVHEIEALPSQTVSP